MPNITLKRATRFKFLDKEELVTFICGLELNNYRFITNDSFGPYITFTGNQWNENYEWDRKKLSSLDKAQLLSLIETLYK